MALGDGIRRNVATITQAERDRLRDAIVALHQRHYSGGRSDSPTGGVSFWFKQDEVHQATHVHGGPEFLPWHRELCNRFEQLLREVDPQISLHYWDWTTDPQPLFTNTFMGSANGSAGDPWLAAGFYVPNADPYRGTSAFDAAHSNPFDPPRTLTRGSPGGIPSLGASDAQILQATSYPQMRQLLETAHDDAHGYIGGTIGDPHTSFRDPFVYLLHSNVDRLLAMWQTEAGQEWRLDPNLVYGTDGAALNGALEPWAGVSGTATRPWAPPENQQLVKTYKHISIVAPPCYDTLPTVVRVIEAENPGMVIHFNDVPEGETAARAAVFELYACTDITLEVKAGSGPSAPYAVLLPPGTVTVLHGAHLMAEARIWFAFTGGAANTTAPDGSVTVRCVETAQEFTFTLKANTIARPTVAVCLTLDKSGSMGWLAGIDQTTKRIDLLHQAGARFIELVPQNNGVGVVRFDHDAYPGTPVNKIGTGPFDTNRVGAVAAVQATNPGGATSIGDGVALARNTVDPVAGYDQKAVLVFTDGLENTPKFIADVMGSINDRTFAIGLGTAQQVSTGALNALTLGTNGYLLLTGNLTSSLDDYFRLSKYFLQILAGVTNTNIVTDPTGVLWPGIKVRIPFSLNETDIEVTAVLLTDSVSVPFRIETPDGDLMDPATAAGLGATFAVGTNMSYYRFTLPLPIGATGARDGTWYVVLEAPRPGGSVETHARRSARVLPRGIRYSMSAHAFSNLRMGARVSQNSLQPGATLTARALLTEYGIPVSGRATVRAEVDRPDQSRTTITLPEIETGAFEAGIVATIPGVYRFRVLATGITLRGLPFSREHLLTAAVFQGGDAPFRTSDPEARGRAEQLCSLLECLSSRELLGRFLQEHRIDADALKRCLLRFCAERPKASERELREREGVPPTG